MPAPSADTRSSSAASAERAELYDALAACHAGDSSDRPRGWGCRDRKDHARRGPGCGAPRSSASPWSTGHCLDIEADISFAPVVEAVRTLVGGGRGPRVPTVARRMRALLDPGTPRSPEPFRLLEDLRLTVLEAADGGPLMLVLEDLHWADRSTQDLAVAARPHRRGRLLLVLTVRTDDLHRRHPARRTLAEISRAPRRATRRPGVLWTGTASPASWRRSRVVRPDPSMVRSVLARSEGNPLYAEELVGCRGGDGPGSPRRSVPGPGRRPGRRSARAAPAASVDGTRVDTDTLAELARLDHDELGVFLRELLDANVLRAGGRAPSSFGTRCCARPSTTTCSPTSAPGSTPSSPPSFRRGSTRIRTRVCRC